MIFTLRPFTCWIAERLEQTLQQNDDKEPWETAPLDQLEAHLLDEISELHHELAQETLDYERVKAEALDVVAMAGMIAARVDSDMGELRRGRSIYGDRLMELFKPKDIRVGEPLPFPYQKK